MEIKKNYTPTMRRTFTFLASYKHLGPLQITVRDLSATVISILGIRKFDFERLPKNRNNKYTILKLALRSYLNLLIDNFDNLGSDQEQTHKNEIKQVKTGRLMGFLMNFVSALTLDSADPVEKLKGLVARDYRHFDWESVGDFMEVDSYDSILDLFHIPVLVQFENFEKSFENMFFCDSKTLEISENDISSLTIHHKSIENYEKNMILKSFVLSEMNFYFQLKQCENECFKNIIKAYEGIAEGLSRRFFNRGLGDATVPLDNAETVLDISSKCLAKVYLDNFDAFFAYFNFITTFEELTAESHDLKMKMTDVLAKLMGYSKAFGNICEIDDTREARELSVKFYRLNRLLNEHSENHHLKSLSTLRKTLAMRDSVFEHEDILCTANCIGINTDVCYTVLLFTSHLAVLDKNSSIKLVSKVQDVDVVLYNKFLYLILPESTKLPSQFQKIMKDYGLGQDNTSIVAFRSFDREATENFCERYYQTKYGCKRKGHYFYCFLHTTDNNINVCSQSSHSSMPDLFHSRIAVSNLEDPEVGPSEAKSVNSPGTMYSVKIEDCSFRAGGIERLTQKELLERIDEVVKQKRIELMNLSKNISAIIAIVKHADQSRVKPPTLDVYPEDEVRFQRKREIFEHVCSKVLKSSNEPDQAKHSMEAIMHLLGETIIGGCDDANKHYNRVYYTLLYSQPGTECTSCLPSLEDKIVLLCMLTRRNLYYFFDSEDLEKLNENTILWDTADKIKGLKSYTLRYFKNISSVINHLRRIGKDIYKDMLIKAIFAKSTN